MIQNIKNIIKLAYFSQSKPHNPNTKTFKKPRPPHLTHTQIPPDLAELCTLIHSQQRCQHWIILVQNNKQNYLIKQELYNAVMDCSVTVHNLFLMLIQCRVLGDWVWLPIQVLCRLKGDADNQLCCLIHFTVLNLGKRLPQVYNPRKWSREKAERELGTNFKRVYNNADISLQEKIAILPMLLVLNDKNSAVLWNRLSWLYTFPYSVIVNLHMNMRKLTEQRLSTAITLGNTDYFSSKMCIKAIQLLEVQGFVSVKNLFAFAYELYNISLLLSLLAGYEPTFNENHHTFRLQLIEFTVQFFDCMEMYEFQFEFGKNNRDMGNLKEIVVRNRLYMEELGDIRFNQELLKDVMAKYEESQQYGQGLYTQINLKNSNNINIARLIPRCWSQLWLTEQQPPSDPDPENSYSQPLTPQKPQQKISQFRTKHQQTILTHILTQLYSLKTDYLQLLYSILMDCYQRDEEPWSEINSSFFRLQVYLIGHCLLEFFVYHFNSLETRDHAETMICYYRVLGLVMRGNPMAYGKMDRILINIEQQMGKASPKTRKRAPNTLPYRSPNLVENLSLSFIQNMPLSKTCIFMILSDQFQWKENQLEGYPNARYESYFVKRVIEMQRVEWMVGVVESICCLCPVKGDGKGEGKGEGKETREELVERCEEKYQWVTLLLALFYYFQETVELAEKNKKLSKVHSQKQTSSQKQKIYAPNKAFLDRMLQNQKFLQKLYPRKTEAFYSKTPTNELKILCEEDLPLPLPQPSTQKPPILRQERMLTVLLQILDRWEQFYNSHSKRRINEYCLSYPMLRVFKKKFKSRVAGFVKTKEFQENGELCFSYSKKNKSYDERQ